MMTTFTPPRGLTAVAFLLAAAVGGPASAQDGAPAQTLPGGASSLRETHGDWIVNCAIGGSEGSPTRQCVLFQEQLDPQSSQRIVAVELQPGAEGASGALVVPFGLDLKAGIDLAVNDGGARHFDFSTCLPGGCIVPLTLDAAAAEAWRAGDALTVSGRALGGEETTFSLPLRGFASALSRTSTLQEQ